MPRLAVARLTLTDFRCYGFLRVDADARPVILTGPNGAGKTNVLEALSFLVPGRGLRGARLGDVARREAHAWAEAPAAADEDDDAADPSSAAAALPLRRVDGAADAVTRPWGVSARLEGPAGMVEIGTGLEAGQGGRDRRSVRVDGQPARGQAELARHVSAVWLTPQMDRLFQEGGAARRRFLDRLVFGLDPGHASRVAAHEHAQRERLRLLRAGHADDGWLSALEQTLAETAVAVAAARRDVAERLDAECAAATGPFPAARVAVSGTVEDWLDQGPALAAEDRLRDALARARGTDAAAGRATVGAHRSDLVVHDRAGGRPAAHGSTGEQKALLVALLLADARLQRAAGGAAPLLFLDEVAAHLDEAHRAALFDDVLALGVQAWMTGTDPALFRPLARHAQFFAVTDAQIRRVG